MPCGVVSDVFFFWFVCGRCSIDRSPPPSSPFFGSKSPVSVTVCVLGSIGTEGNKSKTKDRIAVSYAPIDGAAASIVDGSLSRARTTYYPYMLTRASRVASALAPGLVDVNVLEVFRQVFELTNAEADAAAE